MTPPEYSGSVKKITSQKKVKSPSCGLAAWVLSELGQVGAISEVLVEFDDDHLQDLNPTCPHTF